MSGLWHGEDDVWVEPDYDGIYIDFDETFLDVMQRCVGD